MLRKSVALFMAFDTLVSPVIGYAASYNIPGFPKTVSLPSLATNALPDPRALKGEGYLITNNDGTGQMVINQSQQSVIIDWNKFNIGATAAVYFSQKNSNGVAQPNWAALNRIYDQNPSLIYGKLSSDGKVYLINQNGILFGPTAQINVNSLTASALNIWNADFKNGLVQFRSENYQHPDYRATGETNAADAAFNLALPAPDSTATIANYGNITADTAGSILLVGPRVENYGVISSTLGKIDLVAVAGRGTNPTSDSSEVKIYELQNYPEKYVTFSQSAVQGTASNAGQIIAPGGRIGMYGDTVRQDGLVRAVSLVKQGGTIYLKARTLVETGAKSVTESPPSDLPETADQSFPYTGGTINLGGLDLKTSDTSLATPTALPLKSIEHNGSISAPSGKVSLVATDQITLGSSSSVNVAGLWLDLPASSHYLNPSLNSVELKDDYSQKDGPLKGNKISVDQLTGSTIGDVSGSYTAQERTAEERSLTGGSVYIGGIVATGATPLAKFDALEGSLINFSGGRIRYGSGTWATTKLLYGNKVYDISTAPDSIAYDKVLGVQTATYQKFGITETYHNLYLGGGTALLDNAPGRTEGRNAGSLTVVAQKVDLNGTLLGGVTRGQYQTAVTPFTDLDHSAYDTSVARGLEEPVGGTLTIGVDPGGIAPSPVYDIDSVTNRIEVTSATSAASSDATTSRISAATLSNANLSRLSLFANTAVTVDQGAELNLLAGGSLAVRARRIENYGEIQVPGGTALFTLRDNLTTWSNVPRSNPLQPNPSYENVDSALIFGSNSVVSVAGVKIDNSGRSGAGLSDNAHTAGGTLAIEDFTIAGSGAGHTLTMAPGAIFDVSGGYEISQGGKVVGANAGSLTLRAMDLDLGGTLRGLALPGKTGGEIKLHAGTIVVEAEGASSVPVSGILLLPSDRFSETGFTRISLTSFNDVTFQAGSQLQPSTARLPIPSTREEGATADNAFTPLATSMPDYLGATSLSVTAGKLIYTAGTDTNNLPFDTEQLYLNASAKISLAPGATLSVAPGGTITAAATFIVADGKIDAPGGTVSLTAGGNLSITGTVSAAGYLRPTSSRVGGLPVGYLPQPGGSVNLEAAGDLELTAGSTVDVSGSTPVATPLLNSKGSAEMVPVASAPGSLSLKYGNNLDLSGTISGKGYLNTGGGSLTVNNAGGALSVSQADLQLFTKGGFDALTLKSSSEIAFDGTIDFNPGRSLTLDAGRITGNGQDSVNLQAPWIRLVNTSDKAPTSPSNGTPQGNTFSAKADWIDVEGFSYLTGFSSTTLAATRDLTLTDRTYFSVPMGGLTVGGDLTLQGARIYPTTASSFAFIAHGKVTILPSGYSDTSPIYSAGGSLTVASDDGKGIEVRGYLAAPMGNVTLASYSTVNGNETPEGRVFLADGSAIDTSGKASVLYGSFDGSSWTVPSVDANGKLVFAPVGAAPGKSIDLQGAEVVVSSGAKLDMSGGGTVFTDLYQPSIQGTANPITVAGISQLTYQKIRPDRYVILADNSVQLPGFTYTYSPDGSTSVSRLIGAVYLEGAKLPDGTVLKAGTYSLLPEQFAFLPGALVLSDLGTTVASGAGVKTSDGYQVVGGYRTFLGTGISSPVLQGYSVRSAAEVLKEGNFIVKQFTAGDGGSLKLAGATTVLAGTVNAASLAGYAAGSFNLSGAKIDLKEGLESLGPDFTFEQAVPDGLTGLHLAPSFLSSMGIGTLTLGDSSTTQITIGQGSRVNVPNINLTAGNGSIILEADSQLNGISSRGGTVSLTASGQVQSQANSVIHATSSVAVSGSDLDLKGSVTSDAGVLKLTADRIFFVPDTYARGQNGLYLNKSLWDQFAVNRDFTLVSRSDMVFSRSLDWTAANSLTLDSQQFTSQVANTDAVALHAKSLTLSNSQLPNSSLSAGSGGGSLSFGATSLTVSLNSATDGSNNPTGGVGFSGFTKVSLTANNDLTLQGVGTLNVLGDLTLKAARVTTSYIPTGSSVTYNAPNFSIAATGAVTIAKSDNGVAGSSSIPGGNLAITGRSISDAGVIEVPSGQITLKATGGGDGDGVFLTGNAVIRAQGSKQATADPDTFLYTPGGRITLSSDRGQVGVQGSAVLDVSAKAEGDADGGMISLLAPIGGVTLDGNLSGSGGATGKGGSFILDTFAIGDFASLNGKLGGFTDQIHIRARSGDLAISSLTTVSAHEVVLEADGNQLDASRNLVAGAGMGNLTLAGSINALSDDDGNGGRVELYAQNALSLGGAITASGTGIGGYVYLNSQSGRIDLVHNRSIDVSGGSAGTGGTVYLRARRQDDGNGVLMDLGGEIRGASQVVAEAFASYSPGSGTVDLTTPLSDAATFMKAAGGNAMFGKLPSNWNVSSFHLRPGIEIDYAGNLALATATDLSLVRFTDQGQQTTGEPGVLSLRAAGNLTINGNLVDHPTAYRLLTSDTMLSSWGMNLVAGTDLVSASPYGVNRTVGNLTIASGKLVYTEDAPIRFASGNNTIVNPGVAAGYMVTGTGGNPLSYTLAGYGGSIIGDVVGDLQINSDLTRNGAIQTATGDIELTVGGNLNLGTDSSTFGAIRTTGEYAKGVQVETGPGSGIFRSALITDYWTYHNGGNIGIDVAGAVTGTSLQAADSKNNAWDYTYGGGRNSSGVNTNMRLSASFEGIYATRGIATMGGGAIEVRAGKDFATQIGTFGTDNLAYTGSGNLEVFSGGNFNGRIRIMDGVANIVTSGSFGTSSAPEVVELANARVRVLAQGDVQVGSILNPDNSRINLISQTNAGSGTGVWNLTYTQNSAVTLASLAGSIAVSGANPYAGFDRNPGYLPSSIILYAAKDIELDMGIDMVPSPKADLQLFAGGSIYGNGGITMTQKDPASVYGFQTGSMPNFADHSTDILLQRGDSKPVDIQAGEDITGLTLTLTKKAEISALGGDIREVIYRGENIDPSDVTSIRAGGDIHYDFVLPSVGNVSNTKIIQQSGPGTLVVQAGGNIDLGNSQGIVSVGNSYIPVFGDKGADLVVVAGAKQDIAMESAVQFFDGKDGVSTHDDDNLNGLRKAGRDYDALKGEGKLSEANARINQARAGIIRQYFDYPAVSGSGRISMVSSQISTLTGADNIYVLARGSIDVGKSSLAKSTDSKGSGIFTASGGKIDLFAGSDVNVNESRVMSFLGGDITIWSDQGNINAGRGANATINASPPKWVVIPETTPVQYRKVFTPPAVGSGIRALSYDPDGTLGPNTAPAYGDIYVYATNGIIDAGEAGISGGKVFLGATEVLNAKNISSLSGAVGMPAASDSSLSLGALSGAGSVNDNSKMIEQSSTLGATKDKAAQQASSVDELLSKWLDLKIISFDTDEPADNAKEKRKK